MKQQLYFFITHKHNQPAPIEKITLRSAEGDVDGLYREALRKEITLQHFFDIETAQVALDNHLLTRQQQETQEIDSALNDLLSWSQTPTPPDQPKAGGRGGKRPGAGFKKGMKRGPQSQQHKDKIAQVMTGNQNATKQ